MEKVEVLRNCEHLWNSELTQLGVQLRKKNLSWAELRIFEPMVNTPNVNTGARVGREPELSLPIPRDDDMRVGRNLRGGELLASASAIDAVPESTVLSA